MFAQSHHTALHWHKSTHPWLVLLWVSLLLSSCIQPIRPETVDATNTSQLDLKVVGLYTVDISDPIHPSLISEIRLAPRLVGVWADQGFVYVSSDKGLYVVDCTDPARPTVAVQLDLNANDGSPVLVNGYLYAVANRQLAITCLSPMITLACASLISQNRRNRAKLCFSKHWIAPPK